MGTKQGKASMNIGHNSGRLAFTAPIEVVDPNEAKWLAILESDSAFNAWVKSLYDLNVFVRAKVYEGRSISSHQEVGSWGSAVSAPCYKNGNYFRNEPRRPVIMAGAFHVLIARYSWTDRHIAAGYASRLVKRYLRRIRYTCDDKAIHRENMDRLATAIRRKFARNHVVSFGNRYWTEGRNNYVGPQCHGSNRAGKWVNGHHLEYDIKPLQKPALKLPTNRQQEARKLQSKIHTPRFRTTRTDERAILRAVYDLGLIKEGDQL